MMNGHQGDVISNFAVRPASATAENVAASEVTEATATGVELRSETNSTIDPDPLSLSQHKHQNVTRRQMKIDHPKGNQRKLKKFYTKQNELIDQFLNSGDEERLQAVDEAKNGPRVRFAINASFVVNFCLFVIQLYAAVSTGSLSLFATAADAFVRNLYRSGYVRLD
jgi:hypothetical protein